ncbi:hypothetical protein CsSME_00053236 [Camellia sinensis var. sinensis]
MISKFGFCDKWCSWMKECVISARIFVLVNGSPIEGFNPQRGLWQGDPLYPFLFNIAAEGLHILLFRAHELGLIEGIKMGSNGVVLSHLQFSDDLLLFCEAEVRNLKRVPRSFEIMSWLEDKLSQKCCVWCACSRGDYGWLCFST